MEWLARSARSSKIAHRPTDCRTHGLDTRLDAPSDPCTYFVVYPHLFCVDRFLRVDFSRALVWNGEVDRPDRRRLRIDIPILCRTHGLDTRLDSPSDPHTDSLRFTHTPFVPPAFDKWTRAKCLCGPVSLIVPVVEDFASTDRFIVAHMDRTLASTPHPFSALCVLPTPFLCRPSLMNLPER